jgi:hypothetical protein
MKTATMSKKDLKQAIRDEVKGLEFCLSQGDLDGARFYAQMACNWAETLTRIKARPALTP